MTFDRALHSTMVRKVKQSHEMSFQQGGGGRDRRPGVADLFVADLGDWHPLLLALDANRAVLGVEAVLAGE